MDFTYFRQCFVQGWFVLLTLATGCGGAVTEDVSGGPAAGSSSGGGDGGSAGGGKTSVHSRVCYGQVVPPGDSFCSGARVTKGPLDAGACIVTVPINEGMRLNPEYLRLRFEDEEYGDLEIPYVGTADDCPSTGTTGGWYATNLQGGDTDVGLCDCSCRAAQEQEFTLILACGVIDG